MVTWGGWPVVCAVVRHVVRHVELRSTEVSLLKCQRFHTAPSKLERTELVPFVGLILHDLKRRQDTVRWCLRVLDVSKTASNYQVLTFQRLDEAPSLWDDLGMILGGVANSYYIVTKGIATRSKDATSSSWPY